MAKRGEVKRKIDEYCRKHLEEKGRLPQLKELVEALGVKPNYAQLILTEVRAELAWTQER